MGGLKNRIAGILFGLACAVTLTAGGALAKETDLTSDNVSRFLASFSEMRDIAIGEGLKTGMDSEAAKNPLGAVLKAIRSSKLKTDSEKIAVAHGFAGLKDWAGTGGAIAHSYLFITTGPTRGLARETIEKNKDAAVNQLEKLGLLNDKSKQKLKEGLDSVTDQLAKEPPPGNIAVVKQMMPEIEATVKMGGN